MLLLIDLSNANIRFGVFDNSKLIYEFRTYPDPTKTKDEYEELLAQSLAYHHISPSAIQGAILSSVVPFLTLTLAQAVSSLLGHQCLIVNKSLRSGLAIRIDNPEELGSDLICDALGAITSYSQDCLIADVGSATTLTIATGQKEYLGGIIAPGLRLSGEALWKNAALITPVELTPPLKYLSKSSSESTKAGILFGHAEMIKGLASKLEAEYQKPLKKVLTGLDSPLIKDLLKDFTYDPLLLFKGLLAIYDKNAKEGK